MNKVSKLLLASGLVLGLAAPVLSYADDPKATDRFVYFGVGGGISDPVVKSFEHKETKISLRRSNMIELHAGYGFYPNMMVEISVTHQPQYKLGYILPQKDIQIPTPFGQTAMTTPKIPGKTDVRSEVISLNLIYQLNPIINHVKPYVIFGAGMARINMKATFSSLTLPTGSLEVFKVRKNIQNYLAWQFGGGLSFDLSENLEMDLGAKIQVVNNVRIKYDTLNLITQKFEKQPDIKKTLGVGEFTVSFNYKLPL